MGASKTALIVVDVQYDFLPPDGSLAVPDGQEILPVIQDLLDSSKWDWSQVIVSQDYHPKQHISFASTHPQSEAFSKKTVTDVKGQTYEQTMWPDHCIQHTKGAEIERSLSERLQEWQGKVKIVRKGTHLNLETYSAFEGYITDALDPDEPPSEHSTGNGTKFIPGTYELSEYLRSQGVERVVTVGLAMDFCVLQTALSALSSTFRTAVLAPAVRGISAEDTDQAFERIERLGGQVLGRDSAQWEDDIQEFLV